MCRGYVAGFKSETAQRSRVTRFRLLSEHVSNHITVSKRWRPVQ